MLKNGATLVSTDFSDQMVLRMKSKYENLNNRFIGIEGN